MKEVAQIREIINTLEFSVEIDAVEAGNKAAGTRVRKAMQEIKKLAQAVRVNITNLKKANKA